MMKINKNTDPLEMIQAGLDLYQARNFGKRLVNCGDIIAICEALGRNQDVLVKNRGSYAELIEMQPDGADRDAVSFFRRQAPGPREDYQLKNWQMEIMERDQARSGCLYGTAI